MARILIADDDLQYSSAFAAGMKKQGHEVTQVPSGDEAFRVLSETGAAFDIVFLDMLMGQGGGASTLHRIQLQWPGLPIVIITGQRPLLDSPLFEKGLRSASRLLHKSARLPEINEVVNELLGPSP